VVRVQWEECEIANAGKDQMYEVAQKVMSHIFFLFQNKDSNVKIDRQQH
jgi:hypothetical protein